MNRGLAHAGALATVLALLLAITAVDPAAAANGAVRVPDAEKFAMKLLNCTRTGGWVKADGSCVGRGSGRYSAFRKTLPRHPGISRRVAWPWARALVNHNVCGHTISGRPGPAGRLIRKGYRHSTNGENVGCGWGYGDAKDVVLLTHLAFQDEKADRGGHWRNIKNRRYRSVGVGVATRDGRTTVVYDFYGRRW